jgi:hypothetical protein
MLWRPLASDAESGGRREAVATLARLIESGDQDAATLLRALALETLPGAARFQLLDALLVAALDDPARALEGFLHDAEPAIRTRAWQRLAEVRDRLDNAVTAGALAFEEDESVLAAALRAVRVEEQGETLAVADPGQDDRWRLVEVLLGRVDAASLKGVDAVLDQVGTEGRNRILRTLAMNVEDESGIRRLFGHASAPDASAVPALRAVSGLSGALAARARDLFLAQAKSADALVRQEAVTQLGRCAEPGSLVPLENALADESAHVRVAAAIALWRHGDHRGGTVLVDALDDPELGFEARALLQGSYADAIPTDAASWRRWLEDRKK